MRICHASNFLTGCHQKCGGAEMACYLVAKGLEERGISNLVMTLKHDRENTIKFAKGIKSMEDFIGKKKGRFYKVLIPFDPIVYFSAKKVFEEFKPSILHLHNFSFLSLFLILAARRMKIPIVYSVYDYWTMCPTETLERPDGGSCEQFHGVQCRKCFEKRRFAGLQSLLTLARKPIFNWFLKQISMFITLSENSKGILIRYGVPAEKIQTIRLPTIEKTSVKIPKKIEDNSIFFAGWIEKRKGVHILMRAMAKVVEKIPKAKLYALGMHTNEKETAEVREIIKEANFEKNVFFTTERVPAEDFEEIFSKSSIVAVPEQWVNMSPVILFEAMSFSKPIVASRIGGIPEFVKDGFNGKLIEPKDIDRWADAICSLLGDKRLLEKMRINAGKMFKEVYDKEKTLKELIELYTKVIENGKVV